MNAETAIVEQMRAAFGADQVTVEWWEEGGRTIGTKPVGWDKPRVSVARVWNGGTAHRICKKEVKA